MDKNSIKRLAENPHYTMNDRELQELAQLLQDEAIKNREEEGAFTEQVIEKNRVPKQKTLVKKTTGLKEASNVNSK